MDGSYLRAVVQEKGTGERPGTASQLDQRPLHAPKTLPCSGVGHATQHERISEECAATFGAGSSLCRTRHANTNRGGTRDPQGGLALEVCDLGISETGVCTALCVRCSRRHIGF